MNFTYQSYGQLMKDLKDNGYMISSYHDYQKEERCVILRHDIDSDVRKALELARRETLEWNVKSTYFVLLTSDFYNPFSLSTSKILKDIISYGHEIGLHFDEVRYQSTSVDDVIQRIIDEAKLLEQAVEQPITTVPMHRPSKAILESDIQIPGIINSYGNVFFNEFKYLSDSRRRWREPVEDIIRSKKYKWLHILTHAFWYNDEEIDISESIGRFIKRGSRDRYDSMFDNITDLESILSINQIGE